MRTPHVVLTGSLLGACLAVFGFQAAAPATSPTSASAFDDGKEIYTTRCMSCHQADGAGIAGVFPPLNESEWVTADKGRLIRIILQGVTGEIEVNGVVYSGAMPPWSTFLNDDQTAALLTYIRAAWDNDASAVTAQEVAAVRAATKDRKAAWTQDELMQEANTGIPGQQAFPNFMKGANADSTGN